MLINFACLLPFLKRKYLWNDKNTQIYFMNLMAVKFEIESESMIFTLKNIDDKASFAIGLQWFIKQKLLFRKVVNILFFYFYAINSE